MSSQPDITQLSDSDLQKYFQQCVSGSNMVEMARVGTEMTQRWNRVSSNVQSYQAQLKAAKSQATVAQQQATAAQSQLSSQQNQPVIVQQQVQKMQFEKPECFDGNPNRLSDFLFSVRQYLDCIQENDPIRRQQFASALLTKKALTWWRTECSMNTQLHANEHFDDFCVSLEAAFRDVNHEQRVRQQLFALHQAPRDTVQSYIQRFRQLTTELGSARPDDNTLMFQFINGLLPDIRFQLDLNPPSTRAEAELHAEQVYQAICLHAGAPRQQQPAFNTSNSRVKTPRGAPMELGHANSNFSSSPPFDNGKGKKQVDNNSQKRDYVCYRCNKRGHTARFCRAPAPISSQPRSQVQNSTTNRPAGKSNRQNPGPSGSKN